MDLSYRFPNELWLEVFAHLPLDALRNLSSTRRALYDIARPLDFTDFRLYFYQYDLQPPKEKLDDALERLSFWSSPRIAPLVRSCTATWNMYRWHGSAQVEDTGSAHVLVNTFFERLPLFTGLQRLYTDRVQFTQTGIVNLCALPALTHAEFTSSRVAAGEHLDPSSSTLRVATFITRFDYMNDFWIALLSHDILRELKLSDNHALADSKVPPFPNVHTLTVSDISMRGREISSILTKFPAVRIFSTDYTGVLRDMTPMQESSIFPVLQEYTGAYQNLHIFVQRTSLTHITLESGYPFRNLLPELHGVTALRNITSLTARFSTSVEDMFDEAEINTIFTFFPCLSELQLSLLPDAEDDGGFTPQATSFLQMLATMTSLPSTLKSLSLDWDFPYQYGSTDSAKGNDPAAPDPALIPDFTRLRNKLMAKCPSLTYLFLDGYHFLFLRWETSWVWEATAKSYDDAEILRGQMSERKYGPLVFRVC
ncbi:hypothetical protein MVEN_01390000 [Mycena venus]|uniref:F-box domain-containing protein n=1 Tax=Mycena venus TaxID=2733690 RepID=A0A8H6XYH4_9AGAR|nr:hypothetical protein MVEN_01390000 [Mycena venus]